MSEQDQKSKQVKKAFGQLASVADLLWQRGWAERNAGNMSINVSDVPEIQSAGDDESGPFALENPFPELAGKHFIVTATGSRMRDVRRKPVKNSLLIRISGDGTFYSVLNLRPGKKLPQPTSELTAHLGIHRMIAVRGSAEKAVLHTHVTEVIALTQAREFCDAAAINRMLWGMHPENAIFLPQGVGFIPYCMPGTAAIAERTIEALRSHNLVIWEKHGVFAVAASLTGAFDLADLLAKSATIYLACRAAGFEPEGMPETDLAALRTLAEKFA